MRRMRGSRERASEKDGGEREVVRRRERGSEEMDGE